MVGPWGLEPQTSSVSRTRSNQLSYGPKSKLDYHEKRRTQAAEILQINRGAEIAHQKYMRCGKSAGQQKFTHAKK